MPAKLQAFGKGVAAMYAKEFSPFQNTIDGIKDSIDRTFHSEVYDGPAYNVTTNSSRQMQEANTDLVKKGILPDMFQLGANHTQTGMLELNPDNWQGIAINDKVPSEYKAHSTPAQRHERALNDAIDWLSKNPSYIAHRFHRGKVFTFPGGHAFTADLAYQQDDGEWQIFKVEQAGHDSKNNLYRDPYKGSTTKYWRETFDWEQANRDDDLAPKHQTHERLLPLGKQIYPWMHKKQCPISLTEIIDVDMMEPPTR
ncbi:MAG TPA: hypothetical protein V6C81_28450 [Planktothrix sp.]